MNIFFLSLKPSKCAKMYCDQHVIKILLEITQMLYTAWHLIGLPDDWNPPLSKSGHPGYKVAHPNHPMTMWVRSSRKNYMFSVELGCALALEYKSRFNKYHACSEHITWLGSHVPDVFNFKQSPTAYYGLHGIPQCMPPEHHNINPIRAYKSYYKTKTFAKWTINMITTPISVPKNDEEVKSFERKEVQAHGFSWEKEIISNVYHATNEELKQIKYNSKMDLPANLNRLDQCDVSVKTTCSQNTVCMADCLRMFDAVSSGKSIHMVVVHYIQDDTNNTKKITTITEVDLTDSRDLLFGTLTRSQIEELDKVVKSIPRKRKPTEEEYNKMYSLRDSLQKLSDAIHLDIKCNSTQSRLQCSFNYFQQFVEKNPEKIVAKSNTNEFRGGVISSQITSSRRVFKKKQIV